MLRDAWNTHAGEWISWARAPGHDTYWRFHRDAFLPLVPPPGRLTLDVGIAVTHPASTAGRFAPGPEEVTRPFVIDGSWFERRALADTCERDGYTMTFHSEHRPLQAYSEALADAGFPIERLREVGEPDPADKWHRIPLFRHVRALRS